MGSYLCIDCGTRWEGALRAHSCPSPGSMRKLTREINACPACASRPLGDYCGEHYQALRHHPGSAFYREPTDCYGRPKSIQDAEGCKCFASGELLMTANCPVHGEAEDAESLPWAFPKRAPAGGQSPEATP